MYIAIEGIKGSGKSTILNQLSKVSHDFSIFPITKAIPQENVLEQYHTYSPQVQQCDTFCERLFAERAKWHQRHLQATDIILGDRSILTSYVTRWNKWGDPYYTINRSEALHREIMHPNVIIWLQSNPKECSERIKRRPPKSLGQLDEQLFKLHEAAEVYEELLTGKLYIRKVSKAQIIQLPSTASLIETTNEIQSILNFYNN